MTLKYFLGGKKNLMRNLTLQKKKQREEDEYCVYTIRHSNMTFVCNKKNIKTRTNIYLMIRLTMLYTK